MKFIIIFFCLSLNIQVSAQILDKIQKETEKHEEEKDEEESNPDINNGDAYRMALNSNGMSSRLQTGRGIYIGRLRQMPGMDGDIYLEREFKDATVLTPEDEIAYTKARYRVVDDEIEIKGSADEEELILFKDKVKAISIDGQVFVPLQNYDKEGELKPVWLELLSEGSINLYKEYTIRIQRSNYNPSLNTGNKNDEMLVESTFYYSTNSSKSIKKLKKGRTKVLEVLKKRKNRVNEYARENHLRWSKQEDLVQLFDCYNEKDKKE